MKKIILNYKTTATKCERRGILVWYVQLMIREGLNIPNHKKGGEVVNPRVQLGRRTLAGGWRRQSSSRAPGRGCGSLVL